MSTIAEQVSNHLKYGNITFEESGIAETDQFYSWYFDEVGDMYACFIDESKLLIQTRSEWDK